MEKNELYHYGVKGMKWGVRKQYIKKAGHNVKKKASKLYADIKKKVKERREAEKSRKHEEEIMKKPIKKLSTSELQERARILAARKEVLSLEKSCKDIDDGTKSAGKAFIKNFAKEAIGGAIISAGKNVGTEYFTKIGKDLLGLKDDNSMDKLKKEAETWKLKGQIADGKLKSKNWKDANKKDDDDDDDDPPPPPGGNPEPPSGGSSKSKDTSKSDNKSTESSKTDSKSSSSDESTKSNTKSWDDFKQERSESSSAKSNDSKVYTGDVEGEGTSKRSEPRSKTSYDYDVDLSDTSLSTVRSNTSLVSTGSQYVQYLLEDKSK